LVAKASTTALVRKLSTAGAEVLFVKTGTATVWMRSGRLPRNE
jgi:hypothetical protein